MSTAQISTVIQPLAPEGLFRNEPFIDFRDTRNVHAMRDALTRVGDLLGHEYQLVIGGERSRTAEKIQSLNPARPAHIVGIHQKAGQEHAELAMKAGCATAIVLNDEQHVQPAQQHRVHVEEVHRQDAVGLGREELLPCRSRPAWRWVQPAVFQDRPYGRCRDRMAQAGEFAVDPTVTPQWVVSGHLQHQSVDRRRGCWSGPWHSLVLARSLRG